LDVWCPWPRGALQRASELVPSDGRFSLRSCSNLKLEIQNPKFARLSVSSSSFSARAWSRAGTSFENEDDDEHETTGRFEVERPQESIFQERSDRCWLELLTAAKKFQLDQKLRFEKLSAGFADEDSCSRRSSTGCQQIIYQHNLLA
jgi:hypothetical protein